MKRILILLTFSVVALHASAQVTVTPAGLSVDTTFLTLAEEVVSTAEFATGSRVEFVLSGIKGFSIKNGKSFPGLEMKVFDSRNQVIMDYADLFAEYTDGVDSEQARTLTMTLLIGSPMEENQTYTWYGRIWDKNRKAELIVRLPVKIIPGRDMLGITKKSNGLTFSSVYLFDQAVLKNNKIKEGDKVTFVFTGVGGYTPDENNLVKIGMQVRLLDADNVALIEYEDMFRDYGPVDATRARTLTTYLTVSDPMMPGNSYTWYVKVWDKGTDKSMEASVVIEVESDD